MRARLVLVALAIGVSAMTVGCVDGRVRSPTGRVVAKEAPPGSFNEKTTFKLKVTFETWYEPGAASDRFDNLGRRFEDGVSKAEHEFRRDTFMTNPELADRSKPPAYVVHVDVSRIEDRGGAFPKAFGTLRVVDAKGTVLEEAQIEGSVSRGSEVEEAVLFALGYQVGVYMVCRTAGTPKKCS